MGKLAPSASAAHARVLHSAARARVLHVLHLRLTSFAQEVARTVRRTSQQYITDLAERPATSLDPASHALIGSIPGCQPVAVAACELFWAQATASALRESTDGARRAALRASRGAQRCAWQQQTSDSGGVHGAAWLGAAPCRSNKS